MTRSDYITVHEIPSVSVADAERCGEGEVILIATPYEGDIIEFSASQGVTVDFTDNAAPYQHTVSVAANATTTLWARALNSVTGCMGTWDSTATGISHPIPVTPPVLADLSAVTETGYVNVVCPGDLGINYSVNPVSGSSYNWNIPVLGITQEDATEIQVDWLIARGEYHINVQEISEFGCEGSIRDTLVLVAQPDPDLEGDANICAGQSKTFALISTYSQYRWHDGSTQQEFTTSESGTVSVTVWDEYGCQGSDTVVLTVYPLPLVNLGRDTVICGENSISFDAGDYPFYQWSTGETTNPLTVYAGEKVLWVKVTDLYGCQNNDTIKILACNPLLYLEITNTFTPNNDYIHDTWQIRNIELFPDVSIKVYDRWGRLVYHVDKGYQNDWDGTYNGKDLPMDTYYFILDLKTGEDPITGTVSIVR